jgi:uncharacterized secreted protein with C-terminal beta-propeller domain
MADGQFILQSSAPVDQGGSGTYSMLERDGFLFLGIQKETDDSFTSRINVFNSGLELIGSYEFNSPVRHLLSFIDDKAVLNPFDSSLPFIVVDLSDPYQPVTLGELTLPDDFCQCMFINNKRMIVLEYVWVFTRERDDTHTRRLINGLKLTLYDISEISEPVILSTATIGNEHTNMDMFGEYFTFFYSDIERGLIYLPVSHRAEAADEYTRNVFNGIAVFDISANTIEHDGTITSYSEVSSNVNLWDRATVIGGLYYSTSRSGIQVYDTETLQLLHGLSYNAEDIK